MPSTTTTTGATTQSLQDQCNPELISDDYCDDINNNIDCIYDGGDCCGCKFNEHCCSYCQYFDTIEAGLRHLALRQKMVQHLKKRKISPAQDRLVILSG